VITGMRNENQIIITEGLNEGDLVYLTVPADPDDVRLIEL